MRENVQTSHLLYVFAKGGLAQLVRALALQARGHRFESDILHKERSLKAGFFVYKSWL